MITIRFEENQTETLPLTSRMKTAGKLFLDGFAVQVADESTAGIAIASGLWQGLKYKGNLVRGLQTAATVELTLCALNGVKNVLKNYRKAKNNTYKMIREEE